MDLFNKVWGRLQEELQQEEFRRWLAPLRPRALSERTLTIQVPNIFFKNWITEKYVPKIKRLMTEFSGQDLEVELTVEPAAAESDGLGRGRSSAGDQVVGHEKSPGLPEPTLIEKYRFSNFVVGSSNQLAFAASQAVANNTASFNPLFIYGGSGLGKTHLLNAIGNHLASLDPHRKIVYLCSELFTNELIEALRTEGMSGFRQKYRGIDTLLIDDIHFIGGRERTQEEFFYTFNALYEANKQIVLSSDKMPKEIPDLEDRLRSRFEGGLFADISPPDQETKVAILTRKAQEEKIILSTEVAFYLASQEETNIRVLEGYLSRLAAYYSLTKKPIDLNSAQKLLGLFIEADQKKINLDLILKTTADYYGLKISDLKSGRKQQAVAIPRQAAMYLCRQMTSLSTIEIGQRFGGRDHSTVLHAVKKIELRKNQDHNFSRNISELEKLIKESAQKEN
ncbi:MAG: chromosomal replication initiator protein DnaA [Pseudomonadota bacterium]